MLEWTNFPSHIGSLFEIRGNYEHAYTVEKAALSSSLSECPDVSSHSFISYWLYAMERTGAN